jgi:dTDP-4-amino-4,6-dideoxygalactose transaminase
VTKHEKPAILGGAPARRAPYPPVNFISDAERKLVAEVMDTGVLSAFVAHEGPWFNGGPMVKRLEEEFAAAFGARHAVSVNSATSGLHAAVAAALVGPGDEVIVSPYSMSASATAVVMCGGTPVFADIHPDTFCIDPTDVERKITPRTRAILAVNLFGGPAELEALQAIAARHRLILIEDNAQAPGAKAAGRFTGTVGAMGVFSLNCHKTIQCGEGGVVLTDDAQLADRLRLVRNHGEVVLSQRAEVPDELAGLIGYNYRLTELGAAVALAQLRRLEELTAPRIQLANLLTERLCRLDGITPAFVAPGNRHVYYVYPIKVEPKRIGMSRAQLQAALTAEGVSIASGYVRPIYLYPMYGERVARRRVGSGAGTWHAAEASHAKYHQGLCPVTERMHFEELMATAICRADLGERDALELVEAFEKVLSHAEAVRTALEARGVR